MSKQEPPKPYGLKSDEDAAVYSFPAMPSPPQMTTTILVQGKGAMPQLT